MDPVRKHKYNLDKYPQNTNHYKKNIKNTKI